jgi:UDP-N-acetylglucosamine--N-acetylmuramyl-(pentapeptide) pyrophosphoryl-undecaprenol N-acetylglucosamine transferase
MEAALVQRAGFRFESIPAAGLHGVGLAALPRNLARLLAGVPAARRILSRFNPDVLFFTGGYVGVPVALAGRKRPQAVFVPDVEPGLALRLISRFADLIAVSTEKARAFYPHQKQVLVSGYPTRAWMQPIPSDEARTKFGLQNDLPVLLVFGGSRGAHSINEALWGKLNELLASCQVVHITGELDWPRVSEIQPNLDPAIAERYHPSAYLHEDMALVMSAADLVVSRAGAATLGEFPRFGLPAILVPYPHAWRYQHINADYLVSAGAAITIPDEKLDRLLADEVLRLLEDHTALEEMSSAMSLLDRPQAAEQIADAILTLAAAGSDH